MAAELRAPVIVGLLRGEHLIEGVRPRPPRYSWRACRDWPIVPRLGIDVYLEAINRYETPLLNTAEQTVEVVKQIDRSNVKVLLDVFHMNIEEVSIPDAIRATGDLLGHFHVVDSNRHAPGMGHVDFTEIASALRDIGYKGWISGGTSPPTR